MSMQKVGQVLKDHWGYSDFLPLQKEAIEYLCQKRDCVVVLPTGGGKSICYQAPAAAMGGLAVVVSPLISLMKDQVDALTECGVSAMRLDSSLSTDEQDHVLARIRERTLNLLYVSPERLLSRGFVRLLEKSSLSYIAIDEAHCVSTWGHDFRPEYRQLGQLKKMLGPVTIAAYTATATEQVRRDIAEQLRLDNPAVVVGSFDRPNLIYRIYPRNNVFKDVRSVLDRHTGESGIVYCIRRKDVDTLCARLQATGYRAAGYHAGMPDAARKESQDRFIHDDVDVIVATIAFGMGIDKSNVRYVVHAGMPKSLEHYQQESGRAGRDGLNAECCLFYSDRDYDVWKSLMRDMPAEALRIAADKLDAMHRFCTGAECRHKAILDYFGQPDGKRNCQACDVCLNEAEEFKESLTVAQKILSCVVRLEQKFGAAYTVRTLIGSRDKRIIENGHDQLSTYGILKDCSRQTICAWIGQLTGQGCIQKTGEYKVLAVTSKGWDVLRGQLVPRLLEPVKKDAAIVKTDVDLREGVDQGLFEMLRKLRFETASKKRVPAFVVFSDAVLRELARLRPSSIECFERVKGVGRNKSEHYGGAFVEAMREYCHRHKLPMNAEGGLSSHAPDTAARENSGKGSTNHSKLHAFRLFGQKRSVKDVAMAIHRAESTTTEYLVDYLEKKGATSPDPWVDKAVFDRIAEAAKRAGIGRLKPIFDLLQGEASYSQIRISLACIRDNAED